MFIELRPSMSMQKRWDVVGRYYLQMELERDTKAVLSFGENRFGFFPSLRAARLYGRLFVHWRARSDVHLYERRPGAELFAPNSRSLAQGFGMFIDMQDLHRFTGLIYIETLKVPEYLMVRWMALTLAHEEEEEEEGGG